jgi:hypothetical protein
MPEICLYRPRVLAVVGELVAGAMAQHVAMDKERKLGRLPGPRDHALIAGHTERGAALGDEYVERLRDALALEPAAEERNREEAEQQRRADAIAANESAQLRYALEARLAALEEKAAETDAMLADVFRAISDSFNVLSDQRVELSREQREELRDLRNEVAKLVQRWPSCARKDSVAVSNSPARKTRSRTCPTFCLSAASSTSTNPQRPVAWRRIYFRFRGIADNAGVAVGFDPVAIDPKRTGRPLAASTQIQIRPLSLRHGHI